jgi:predicted nucleic acid-binding protein
VSWLLDSDVLSQPAKKAGNTRVIRWLEKHQHQCYTSSVIIAQLAFWVRTKRGRQRVAMQGRILGFNVSVAHVWADQQYQLRSAGKPMPVEDSYIAAIARRHNLTIATGNVKDFQRPGIKIFDPFAESES